MQWRSDIRVAVAPWRLFRWLWSLLLSVQSVVRWDTPRARHSRADSLPQNASHRFDDHRHWTVRPSGSVIFRSREARRYFTLPKLERSVASTRVRGWAGAVSS